MTATSKHEESPSLPQEPSSRFRWQNIRKWVISMLVIFVFSACTEKAAELLSKESSERIRGFNDSFIHDLKQVDPFRLSKIYYLYIWNGPPSAQLPQEGIAEKILKLPERSIYAVAPTFRAVIAGGMVSILLAVTALGLGAFVLKANDATFWSFPLAPIIGSCFLWALLLITHLAMLLFGWFLEAAGLISAISTTIPLFGWVISTATKEREHHITDKVIERLTRRP